MGRMMIPAIAFAITLAPAALAGQTTDQRGPRGPMGAPVERLIEHREELGLSVQQVADLRRIQTQLQEKNRPLIEQLQAARRSITPEQRQQMRQRADSTRHVMRQKSDSMRQHVRQMTPEQRAQMRERMQQMTPEQRSEMRQRMQRPGGRGAPGARVPGELQPVMQQMRENTQEAARQVQTVLTAEQRQKLSELRQPRRAPRATR